MHESYQKWMDNGKPKIICACGCGEIIIIKYHHRYYGIPEYIRGHSNRNGNHPMLGKRVTEETKEKNRNIHIGKHPSEITLQKQREWCTGSKNPMYGIPPPHGVGFGKGCYYDSPLQGKIWLRSSYELAYAKYLDINRISWLYESKTFDLGNTTYTPDFFLLKENKFIEIKGYMLPKAQEKINKFLEQYNDNLEILYKEDLIKLGIEL